MMVAIGVVESMDGNTWDISGVDIYGGAARTNEEGKVRPIVNRQSDQSSRLRAADSPVDKEVAESVYCVASAIQS